MERSQAATASKLNLGMYSSLSQDTPISTHQAGFALNLAIATSNID
jgi:hypothetical protein